MSLDQNVLDMLEIAALKELFVFLILEKYNIMWTICTFDKIDQKELLIKTSKESLEK